MAEARHYGPMGASVVICANGMAQTITLDANGQKVPFTHVCPDCIMGALNLPAALSLPKPPNFARAISLTLPRVAKVQAARIHAEARGPPVLM